MGMGPGWVHLCESNTCRCCWRVMRSDYIHYLFAYGLAAGGQRSRGHVSGLEQVTGGAAVQEWPRPDGLRWTVDTCCPPGP